MSGWTYDSARGTWHNDEFNKDVTDQLMSMIGVNKLNDYLRYGTLPAGTYDHTGRINSTLVHVDNLPKEVPAEVAMAHEAEPVVPAKPVCGHCHERKASRAVDAFNAYKHNEKDACCAIEDTLKDAAEDEMRAEIKRNLREWPICKVSGEPVDVIFHWDEEKDNLLIAEFHCHECYELSDFDT